MTTEEKTRDFSAILQDPNIGVPEDLRPDCELVGQDGNVFNIIGLVSKALRRSDLENKREKVTEWQNQATSCHSYDEVLQLLHKYVNGY